MDRSELAKRLEWDANALVEMGGLRETDSRVQCLREAASIIRSTAWRPMSEAPRDGTYVLLYDPDYANPYLHAAWDIHDRAWWTYPNLSGQSSVWRDAKAWQPLPPPPTGEVGT